MEEKNHKKIDLSYYNLASFAGGCFWCIQSAFQEKKGVVKVISGYTGGTSDNPTYENINDHKEAVQVYYNPDKISYYELLKIFWVQIDPTDKGGQFADRGNQYMTAIFYHNDEQNKLAEFSKKEIEKKIGEKIVTEIIPATKFYDAEEFHQDYYLKQKGKYKTYKKFSGREKQIRENEIRFGGIKDKLSDIQYKVTQKGDTEPAFNNEYWDNQEKGIYVDIVTGEPLFSSLDKFDSGTGWPSFTKPIKNASIYEKEDNAFGMKRTEVRTKTSHLGHVFNDGTDCMTRYCINSASLKFISKEVMKKEGYEEYLSKI